MAVALKSLALIASTLLKANIDTFTSYVYIRIRRTMKINKQNHHLLQIVEVDTVTKKAIPFTCSPLKF